MGGAVIGTAEPGDCDHGCRLGDSHRGVASLIAVVGVGKGPVNRATRHVGVGGWVNGEAAEVFIVDTLGGTAGYAVRCAVIGTAEPGDCDHGGRLGDGYRGVALLIAVVGVGKGPVNRATRHVGVGGWINRQTAEVFIVDTLGGTAGYAVRSAIIGTAEARHCDHGCRLGDSYGGVAALIAVVRVRKGPVNRATRHVGVGGWINRQTGEVFIVDTLGGTAGYAVRSAIVDATEAGHCDHGRRLGYLSRATCAVW